MIGGFLLRNQNFWLEKVLVALDGEKDFLDLSCLYKSRPKLLYSCLLQEIIYRQLYYLDTFGK